jgi:hypothetical protein
MLFCWRHVNPQYVHAENSAFAAAAHLRAKCGSVVNPGGWDCPRCGVSLHGDGATTTAPPLLPGFPPEGLAGDPPRSQPAISLSSIIGLIVLALMLALYLIFKTAGA